jgi:hypothetical protein
MRVRARHFPQLSFPCRAKTEGPEIVISEKRFQSLNLFLDLRIRILLIRNKLERSNDFLFLHELV